MKILYLTEILPYPLDSGGKIKTFSTLKSIVKKHNVTMVAFTDKKQSQKGVRQEIRKLGIGLYPVYSPKRKFDARLSRTEIIKSLVFLTPILITNTKSKLFGKTVRKLLAEEKFDVIHVDHLSMAQYLPEKKSCLWYYEEHNVEHLIYWNLARSVASFKAKLFYLYEFLTLYLYEKKQLKKFDKIFAISDRDKKVIKEKFNPKAKIDVLKVSIQIPKVTKNANLPVSALIFIGSLLWPPNFSAVTWFCQNILPRIHKNYPNLELKIIGHKNKKIETKLDKFPKCKLIGYVDNIDQYLDRKKHIFVLPFIFGEGIRVKALMAMVYGVPLVSTASGMRGIKAKEGRDYLSADSGEKFAEQLARLLNNFGLRRRISTNAQNFVRKNHTEAITSQILDKY